MRAVPLAGLVAMMCLAACRPDSYERRITVKVPISDAAETSGVRPDVRLQIPAGTELNHARPHREVRVTVPREETLPRGVKTTME